MKESEQKDIETNSAGPKFVHLRVHSEFSIVDGIVKIKPLIAACTKDNMPAVALTDACNFYGLVKFYKAARNAGVKPIIGADFSVLSENQERPFALTLLVQNMDGYRNLTRLISKCYLEGQQQGQPVLQMEWLEGSSDGLIALSGGRWGDVGMALLGNDNSVAEVRLAHWMALFPNRFYLELTRTGRPGEEQYIVEVVTLAAKMDCPVVATNDVRFLEAEEFEAHEARVCINEGRVLDDPRRERRYSDQQYFRNSGEMQALFADLPEALANSVEIARRCNTELNLGDYFLPEYPVPEGMDESAFLEQTAREGLDKRLGSRPEAERKPYLERLKFELEIIIQMGFPGYFLIVMDFIRWAKANRIPVGPGRGSGAGSLVAYALEITDLDPLQYDLLFERFLNPERVSMPDFDIDFCMDNRDRVIGYVAEKYGRDAVSQIITFGTMAAKAVVRDVARVQGKSYGLADKLSKMIPFEIGMTLEKAFEQVEPLREMLANDEEAQEIWDMAVQLEGVTRNVGKHAGGVVIAPTTLTDFAPLYCDETGGGLVTQFDKDDVEQVGLVKFDFLGLRTLTIIDWAVQMVNARREKQGEPPLDINAIPMDDEESFALLQRAETTAVFQLESRGMKDLITRVKPSCFEDIVALVALFRPGPLQSGMVDDFINRKHGRATVAYPHPKYQHPDLKPVLEPTYGIILYQEQVMQIAQVLAGYSLGDADLLRRAMGKKKPEEMAKQRDLFISGAANKGIEEDLASNIFDLMEKFAGYGFNKSHSAAYALLAYQTAWLKAHYPAEFMSAVLSADLQNTDKIVTLIEECRSMKLPILPPDVKQGRYAFTVSEDGEIIYGLGAIKGLGEGPINSIIESRVESDEFKDIFDFCSRVDSRKINKRAMEALIRSGAMDSIGPDKPLGQCRAVLLAAMDEAIKAAEQHNRNSQGGMMDLFGESLQEKAPELSYKHFHETRGLSEKERLQGEKETLGLYLTGHPFDQYQEEVAYLVGNRIANLRASRDNQRIAGLVVGLRLIKTKRGDSLAVVQLDDRSARIEVTLFPDVYDPMREQIVKDAMLVIEGSVSEDDYTGGLKMRGSKVDTLYQFRQSCLKSIAIETQSNELDMRKINLLETILTPYLAGSCPVELDYIHPSASCKLYLGENWRVEPKDELLHQLRENFGAGQVHLRFS